MHVTGVATPKTCASSNGTSDVCWAVIELHHILCFGAVLEPFVLLIRIRMILPGVFGRFVRRLQRRHSALSVSCDPCFLGHGMAEVFSS